jgi:hypothetical protein
VLAAAGIPVKPPQSAREGTWPPSAVRLPHRGVATLAETVLATLTADDEALGGGRFVVVTPCASQADLAEAVVARLAGTALAERVEVMGVAAVKGLEFDAVVLVDPAGIVAQSRRGVNDLYVALTRPTQRLTVLHHGDLPAGLESLTAPPSPLA